MATGKAHHELRLAWYRAKGIGLDVDKLVLESHPMCARSTQPKGVGVPAIQNGDGGLRRKGSVLLLRYKTPHNRCLCVLKGEVNRG